jgi:geranylgeranyl diphosphate synthase type II
MTVLKPSRSTKSNMEIERYLAERKRLVENKLELVMLEPDGVFKSHIEAMRYSLFAGGKRIRPILCLAAAETISDDEGLRDDMLIVGAAIECIHTYSLIHDDLPAMDNDELRRGKPTSHMLFGEAGAILAGDSLLTFAFELLAGSFSKLSLERQLTIIKIVSTAAGPLGMAGGQALDIAGENTPYPFEHLQTIHKSKTGALIRASVQAGAVGGGGDAKQVSRLIAYGEAIGLAFQIVDDLLDSTSTTEVLGKSAGADEARGKATYPAFFGVEETRNMALKAVNQAKEALQGFNHRAAPLFELADYIYKRTH